MVRVGRRAGHSLPELIVAVTLLGVSLAAAGAAAAMGAGRTRDAALRQEAVRQTAAVLDSLLAAPVLVAGERDLPAFHIVWTVAADDGPVRVEVTATRSDGRSLVRLGGPWFPPEPALPRATATAP